MIISPDGENSIIMSDIVIRIKDLGKTFKNNSVENVVLKGINLEIQKGQIIGYIGPNGAGKSTTVKIICGIFEQFEGEIEVFGKKLKTHALEIKNKIGYVPENGALYELLTPREYLSFLATIYNIDENIGTRRIEQLMLYFEMTKHLDERMDTFSKGMRQKIMLIAGLINNPEILFLDEPLSGLDANSVILVKDLLINLAKDGKTIFYCSHLMDIVEKISDRIILINNGNVIADGSFDELKTEKSETLESLFAHLTGKEHSNGQSDGLIEALKEL